MRIVIKCPISASAWLGVGSEPCIWQEWSCLKSNSLLRGYPECLLGTGPWLPGGVGDFSAVCHWVPDQLGLCSQSAEHRYLHHHQKTLLAILVWCLRQQVCKHHTRVVSRKISHSSSQSRTCTQETDLYPGDIQDNPSRLNWTSAKTQPKFLSCTWLWAHTSHEEAETGLLIMIHV